MKTFHGFTYESSDAAKLELVAAMFSEAEINGIEEEPGLIRVFLESEAVDRSLLQEITELSGIIPTETTVQDQNWNALWESNFEPIRVDDFVLVRADFHQAGTGVEQEIVITPKMSFGTGHHATTYMMMQQMRQLAFKGARVFDFGTGTGILAILAEKLGAASVYAIDNDEWSIRNAEENLERNGNSRVVLEQADEAGVAGVRGSYQVILANINKNVIIKNAGALAHALTPGGTLLLSGLLQEDEADVLAVFAPLKLQPELRVIRDKWLCLKLSAPGSAPAAH